MPHPARRIAAALALIAGLVAVPVVTATAADPPTISIDGTSAGRTFDGVGALSAGGRRGC